MRNNFISSIRNAVNAFRNKGTNNDDEWTEISSPDDSALSFQNPGEALKFYRSYTYACINARAENTAKAKLFLFKKMKDGKMKEIDSHPFLELTGKNNIHGLSFFELVFSVVLQLDLYGNAYIYTPQNILKMPSELILLNDPSRMRIEYSGGHYRKYIYRAGEKEIEVIFIIGKHER